jgi:hypothetical protein
MKTNEDFRAYIARSKSSAYLPNERRSDVTTLCGSDNHKVNEYAADLLYFARRYLNNIPTETEDRRRGEAGCNRDTLLARVGTETGLTT